MEVIINGRGFIDNTELVHLKTKIHCVTFVQLTIGLLESKRDTTKLK